jgi:biopolymer transport protein ExbD
MRFAASKRRRVPSVIIVSLIDVLMVVLIFMMVSTTFKNEPTIKLTLPESKQARDGAAESKPLVITVAKQQPFLFIDANPVTLEKLQTELATRAQTDPNLSVFIRADQDAPFGQIIKVMDAAKAANIKAVNAFTQPAK